MQTDLKTLLLKAVDKDKNYSEAHLQLALLYQDENDYKNVEKHFDEAIISDCKDAKMLDDKQRRKRLSVVTPCYNEEGNVAEAYQQIK